MENMTGKSGSRWKHGWVPLNLAAAKLKAHGSTKGMRKIALAPGSKVSATQRLLLKDKMTGSRPNRGNQRGEVTRRHR